MYAAGVGAQATLIGATNSRVVPNPDPANPVVQDPTAENDSNQFMRLMIEQLKNQDPMNPMESNEFTTQLSQINSLEQLISLNSLMESYFSSGRLAESTALIGKYVEGFDSNSTQVKGVVERVEVVDGVATLKIGDLLLLPDQVVTVSDAAPSDGGESA